MSLSTSLLLPIPPLSPSFLRHLPSNGHLVFCRSPGSASIHGGLFRVSSSFSSHGCAAFDGGSEGDLEDDDDDDEVAENGVDSLVLPERWDVLGLGQAMVITATLFNSLIIDMWVPECLWLGYHILHSIQHLHSSFIHG